MFTSEENLGFEDALQADSKILEFSSTQASYTVYSFQFSENLVCSLLCEIFYLSEDFGARRLFIEALLRKPFPLKRGIIIITIRKTSSFYFRQKNKIFDVLFIKETHVQK